MIFNINSTRGQNAGPHVRSTGNLSSNYNVYNSAEIGKCAGEQTESETEPRRMARAKLLDRADNPRSERTALMLRRQRGYRS